MAEQHWIPASYHSSEWAAVLQEKYSSVNFPFDAPDEARFLRFPTNPPSQLDWSSPDGCTSKNYQEVDHLCFRLTGTGLIGADIAATYLREKYHKNSSIFTIKQAAYVVLSFLQFLDKPGANIFSVTRQDICAFTQGYSFRTCRPFAFSHRQPSKSRFGPSLTADKPENWRIAQCENLRHRSPGKENLDLPGRKK